MNYIEKYSSLIILCAVLSLLSPVTGQVVSCPVSSPAGQHLFFRNLNKEDGLPSGIVRYCLQDFHGYVWIATDNGLVRYDGSEMKLFQYVPGEEALMENSVHVLCQSKDSLLWIGTKNGLAIYDPVNDHFLNIKSSTGEPSHFPGDWLLSFYEDEQYKMWIGTDNGLVCSNPRGEAFMHFPLHKNDIPMDRENLFRWVNAIAPSPQNPHQLYLATRGGLLLFDTEKLIVIRDFESKVGHNYRCSALLVENDSSVWTGEWGTGLKHFNPLSGIWTIYNPINEPLLNISYILPKTDTQLYVTTAGMGLGVFNTENHRFSFHRSDSANTLSLPSDILQGNLLALDESLYVTSGKGLSISNPEYRSFLTGSIPFPHGQVHTFLEDTSRHLLYVGCGNATGIFCQNLVNRKWTRITVIYNNENPVHFTSLLMDRQGVLWAGTSRGLFRQEENGWTEILPELFIESLMEDSRGNIWGGTLFSGVFRIDGSSMEATLFEPDQERPGSILKSQEYKALCEDRDGNIWIGCYDGVTVFDPATQLFDNSINDSLHLRDIRKSVVWGIASDLQGRIYLSVDDEGLVRISREQTKGFTVKLYHLHHGLNDLNIFDMQRGPDGKLWIINEGVTCFDPSEETFSVIDTRNGLHGNKNWLDDLYIGPSGTLYLTLGNRFEFQEIKNIDLSCKISNLLIEGLEVNGLKTNILKNGQNVFKAHQRNIMVHFKAICFDDVDQVKYRYKLSGVDEEWRLNGQSASVRFSNLEPGKYKFVVQAAHRGIWYGRDAVLTFTIIPPFYARWWFVGLVALSAGFLLFLIYKVRTRQLLREQKLKSGFEKQLADLEMQALRAQMNPHFIFNSLNSINNFILKNETEAASDFLVKFSRLVRQVLNNSKHMMVSLNDELHALGLYIELEQLRFEHKFTFKLVVEDELDKDEVKVPPLLVQPYIENAIWHGMMHKDGPGEVSLKIFRSDDRLHFIITDDGIGREKAAGYKSQYNEKRKSVGLSITKNRIELLNSLYGITATSKITDLYDEKHEPCGTRVEISIPVIAK